MLASGAMYGLILPRTSLWPCHSHRSALMDGLSMAAGCYVLKYHSSSSHLHNVSMPQIVMSLSEHPACALALAS